MLRQDWATQKIICRSILQGREQDIFVRYAVSDADQAIYRRMAEAALAAVVRRRSPAKRYYTARIRNPIIAAVVLAVAVSVTCFAIALFLWRRIDFVAAGTYPIVGSVAAFAAIGAAAIGWTISGWVTHRTGRSKLTMDVIAARFTQPAFGDALTSFNKVLFGRHINGRLVGELERSELDDDRKALQGLRYLLNFCEFIAVGVLEGEFDERLIAKTFGGTLAYIHEYSLPYISELQRRNPSTLEHFTMLRRHYQEL